MTLRACIVVLFGILVAGQIVAAQNNPDNQSENDSQQQTSTWPSSPYADPDLQNDRSDNQDNVCYTMRTYLFARRDGEPLRHVATFTCTPNRQRDLKRAKTEPRLIPAR